MWLELVDSICTITRLPGALVDQYYSAGCVRSLTSCTLGPWVYGVMFGTFGVILVVTFGSVLVGRWVEAGTPGDKVAGNGTVLARDLVDMTHSIQMEPSVVIPNTLAITLDKPGYEDEEDLYDDLALSGPPARPFTLSRPPARDPLTLSGPPARPYDDLVIHHPARPFVTGESGYEMVVLDRQDRFHLPHPGGARVDRQDSTYYTDNTLVAPRPVSGLSDSFNGSFWDDSVETLNFPGPPPELMGAREILEDV